MWIATTQGFYSVVAHRTEPGMMLVRARAKRDLQNLDRQLPGALDRITQDRNADYPWRLLASREEWTLAFARLMQEVDYDNFKSAVGKRDRRREGIYHRVWDVLTDIEPNFRKRYYRRDWIGVTTASDFDSGADTFPFEPTLAELAELDQDRLFEEPDASRSVSRSQRRRAQRKTAAKKKGARS